MLSFQGLLASGATREQLEAWCRAEAKALPIGDGGLVLCRVLGKYLMYTLSQDLALTPHLAFNGIWEPWVTMAIAQHIKPGMRCLDVGACYGYYSLLISDLTGDGGYVESWEPAYHELVQTNCSLNGKFVIVRAEAMGTHPGDVSLSSPCPNEMGLFNAGGAELEATFEGYGANKRPRLAERIYAPMESPDGTFDFVKIDVEGAEADVWQALARVRAKSPSLTVCMEFTPKRHEDPVAFLRGVIDDGFALGTVGHDGTPRPCAFDDALEPDTGDFRMLWLTREP